MTFSELIRPAAVKVVTTVSSKKMLLHALADLAAQAYDMPQEQTLNALLEREALGPTGVGHGVALPHSRLPGLTSVKGVFIRLNTPIDFSAVDRQPVDLFFGLFAPQDAGVDHLKALALVSRTMRSASICAKLRANDNAETLYTVLTEAQRQKAA